MAMIISPQPDNAVALREVMDADHVSAPNEAAFDLRRCRYWIKPGAVAPVTEQGEATAYRGGSIFTCHRDSSGGILR